MKKYFLVVFLLASFLASAQSWVWGTGGIVQPDTTMNNESGCITVDRFGYIYQTGYFQKKIVFGKDTLTPTSRFDCFITKYNNNGICLWAKQLKELKPGINSATQPDAQIADKEGNIYVVGIFQDEYLVIGNDTLKALIDSPYVSSEMFIAKLDSNGNFIWAKQSKCAAYYGCSIGEITLAIDDFQGIYVTTSIQGFYYFGSAYVNTGGINETMVLIKYDTSGNQKWLEKIPIIGLTNAQFIEPGEVTIDRWNNLYVVGDFSGQFLFGNDTITCPTSGGNNFIFLVKFDTSGKVKWVHQSVSGTTSQGFGYGFSVTTDKYGGVYISGDFGGSYVFGTKQIIAPPNSDLFYAKYDSAGNVLWAKEPQVLDKEEWGGFCVKADTNNEIYFVATGGNGSTEPSGIGFCSLVFGSDTFTLNNPIMDGGSFLIKFDTSGSPLCGAAINSGYYVFVRCDASGKSVYLGGSGRKKMEFGTDTVGIASATTYPFLAKWNPDCSVNGINESIVETIGITFFPNPNNGSFTIQFANSNQLMANSRIEIYNVLGEKVYAQPLRQAQGDSQIDLTNEPNGVYLYRVISEEGKLEGSGKFVIEK